MGMFRLDGRRAIVTGAAQGIGLAIAQALAQQGAIVALVDRQPEALQAALVQCGPQSRGYLIDMAQSDAVITGFQQILADLAGVEILVNNAAVLSTAPFRALPEAEWDRTLQVNLKSVFLASQAVVESMVTQRFGRIIQVASVAGKRGGGLLGTSAYATAKAGVIGLTKALARELAEFQITVNAVAPGPIETSLIAPMPESRREQALRQIPLGRFGQAPEVAAAVVFLASTEAGFITGEILDVDGGISMD